MSGIYRPCHSERTVLYRVVFHHFERFLAEYERRFEREYGYFRPIFGLSSITKRNGRKEGFFSWLIDADPLTLASPGSILIMLKGGHDRPRIRQRHREKWRHALSRGKIPGAVFLSFHWRYSFF